MSSTDQTTPGARPSGMRAKVVAEYAAIFQVHGLGGPVLEIAYGPGKNAVASAPFLAEFERHAVVGRDEGETGGTQFHRGSPNDLTPLFEDGCFGTVIWDRGPERDRKFWLTAAEIRRVLMPGGAVVVCTRGFGRTNKFGVKVVGAGGKPLPSLIATAAISDRAGDNLRFSPQGVRRVVLDGFDVKETRAAFMVPHLFVVAKKPE